MLRDVILKHALLNAIRHGGKANPGAVLGKILAEMPDLRPRAREIMPAVREVVEEVNALTVEEQRALLDERFPEAIEGKKKEESKRLEDLPGVSGPVRMRLAPSPSGPMHIGQSRMAILNDEYVKRYGGTLFLRIEDTNPENIDPDAYDMIPEDLEWLGVKVHETVVQSDRFELYYEYAAKLLEMGHAYICTCPADEWRALKNKGVACPHRDEAPGVQIERWEGMLGGEYGEGEAVYVVKTDLNHPNPAIRDWPAFRIVDRPHPRTGDRYRVYPLMNFSVAVDDHELGLTHVLRGKDHLNNTHRQMYLYEYFGWEKPVYIHYGWVRMKDTVLKTSLIKKGIREGLYTGWDDPRLGTLRALAKRGISPQAIRRYWVEVGLKEVDIEFSWENLYAYNREIVDPVAKRLFFVPNPVEVRVSGSPEMRAAPPLHPSHPEWGAREYTMPPEFSVYVPADEWNALNPGDIIRLKDLCNVRKTANGAEYAGNDLSVLKRGVRIIQWAPAESPPATLVYPDGSEVKGKVEPFTGRCIGEVVQFERIGFARLWDEGGIRAYFAHR